MPVSHRFAVLARTTLAITVLTGALAACAGDPDEASVDPAARLAAAKTALDAASSVHFTLTGTDVPSGKTAVLSGEGSAVRPDKFQGTLDVALLGAKATVKVVSTGGTFYAQLPFTTGFAVTDPAKLGFADPATFMAPDAGLSRLLTSATEPRLGSTSRVDGTVVQEIEATIPGEVVQSLLTSADPSKPVAAVFAVAQDGDQLRRATLTGPFFAAGTDSTYTLELDRYNEQVDISAPPTS